MMNLAEKIFLTLILTRVEGFQLTRLCGSTTQLMTSRGVQMLLTSAQDLISWLLPLKMTIPTLINMVASSTSLQFLFTIKGKRKSVDPRDEIQVLWVRWFEQDPDHEDGFSHLRIPRLQFVNSDNVAEWHGFISPSDVLRATHTIPAFAWDLMDPQPFPEDSHATRFLKEDWNYYYVNM